MAASFPRGSLVTEAYLEELIRTTITLSILTREAWQFSGYGRNEVQWVIRELQNVLLQDEGQTPVDNPFPDVPQPDPPALPYGEETPAPAE